MRRSRVREKEQAAFDIHDRVNYAVTDAKLKIEKDKSVIALNLQIDEKICSMFDYFEIFIRLIFMPRTEVIDGRGFRRKNEIRVRLRRMSPCGNETFVYNKIIRSDVASVYRRDGWISISME